MYLSDIAKRMNINLPVSQINDLLLKNKEYSDKIKERMNRFVWSIINKSNNIEVVPPEPSSTSSSHLYGFKVGPGNNSFVLRRLMTERWWWNPHDKQASSFPNFRWTQWRKNTIIDKIQSAQDFNESKAEASKIGRMLHNEI